VAHGAQVVDFVGLHLLHMMRIQVRGVGQVAVVQEEIADVLDVRVLVDVIHARVLNSERGA
jgi:hypothetical protein